MAFLRWTAWPTREELAREIDGSLQNHWPSFLNLLRCVRASTAFRSIRGLFGDELRAMESLTQRFPVLFFWGASEMRQSQVKLTVGEYMRPRPLLL